MKGVTHVNRSRLFLVVVFALLVVGLPLAGQTPGDEIAKLKARVKKLEAENEMLKQEVARKGVGSLGVPHGQIVMIEGEHDPKTPIKNVRDFRVKSVNGKDLPGDVHLFLRTHEWARSKGTPGKSPRKLKGFQCTQSVGDPYGRTGLAFHLVEVFMVIEVLEEK
jgi:hypothetical protein